jgi:hypothetical protein
VRADDREHIAAKARRAERLVCCRDVCRRCREGWPATRDGHRLWVHLIVDECDGVALAVDCKAGGIRDRMEIAT